MPDVAFHFNSREEAPDAERLERALGRLDCVDLVNVDAEKGLVAVSYREEGSAEGSAEPLEEIERAVKEAGFEVEATPGARRLEERES